MSALASVSEPNFDLLRLKSVYGLRCSTEEEPSEADMSIAYQPLLSNSLEDDSKTEPGMKTQKMKDKDNIFGKVVKSLNVLFNFFLFKIIRDNL